MPFDISNPWFIVILLVTGASMFIGWRLKAVMREIGKIPTSSGMSGKEIAEAMLRHYNIHDVEVLPAKGFLTDHYNPTNKTIRLSEVIYGERSVAAAAVAAHECGHAVQHATKYPALGFRSSLVPVVNIGARFSQYLLYGGLILSGASMGAGSSDLGFGYYLLLAGVILLGASALFSLITLPVEFDASARALKWLDESGFVRGKEYQAAKKGLNWAAMTYVAAAIAALANLMYWAQYLLRAQARR
ncbi:MAG: zinc metallopeptidase [Bacteroidia bacterium]|nr:zinc metallopeptidase [Bacteroidia bacterium]